MKREDAAGLLKIVFVIIVFIIITIFSGCI